MKLFTDEELVARYRNLGDRGALIELVNRYQGPIHGYLLGVLRDPQKAEDVSQETFLRMLRGLDGFRQELPFRPWMFRIARNTARTTWEGIQVRKRVEREASLGRERTGNRMDPFEKAAEQEIFDIMSELPEGQREALTLHFAQGLSHSEVAAVLGVPPGTAATRVHQGLESLRSRVLSLGGLPLVDTQIGLALRSQAPVVAPPSILKVVLESAGGVARGTSAIQPMLKIGESVVKTKAVLLLSTAILCLPAGGLLGYHLHRSRVSPSVPEEALAGRSRILELESTVESLRTQLRQSDSHVPPPARGRADQPALTPPPIKARPASALRKLAGYFVQEDRMTSQIKDRRHPTPEEQAKLEQVMAPMFADPDIIAALNGASRWTADDKMGFTLDLLEELGLPPLSPEQTDAIRQSIRDWVHLEEMPLTAFSSSVEKRIQELRQNGALFESLKSALSPDQQPLVPLVKESGFIGLQEARPQGYVLAPPAPGQAASYILNSWTKQIVELDDLDRARLAGAASEQAARLWSAQAELAAKYGEGFMEFFTAYMQTTMITADLETLLQASKNPNPAGAVVQAYQETHPAWAAQMEDAYVRLLQTEMQNRATMLAALPGKAEAIKKAKPYVYLLASAP